MFISAIENCPHFEASKFIDYNSLQYFSIGEVFNKDNKEDTDYDPSMKLVNLLFYHNLTLNEEKQNDEDSSKLESLFLKDVKYYSEINQESENIYFLCLTCGTILSSKSEINSHVQEMKHYISINLTDISIWCLECINPQLGNNQKGTPINLNPEQLSKLKNHIQYMREKKNVSLGYIRPYNKFYSKEEIFSIKYNRFINNFKQNKFQNIIFMVGAGISTTAGIPDFRSETGLFKQLQDKYGMKSPEEFFMKKTFLEKPELFYEFCKIFDLSAVKPTLTHKFMNYLVMKNIVKYVFTQNIDGLELKAKIPEDKIVFAHGTFTQGHCPQCKINIDINKINKGIEEGTVVKCEICGGPCKPNIVFYGEDLGDRFYEKIQESGEFDLVFIMGTSLQVNPFASIPKLMTTPSWKVVFNRDKVGRFLYDFLFSNTLFIQGTTDDLVKKFLNDVDLLDDFKNFVKNNYGDDSIETNQNIVMMEVNKLEEENKKINDGIKIDGEEKKEEKNNNESKDNPIKDEIIEMNNK